VAVPLRYNRQLPWVGTDAHYDFLTEVSNRTRQSKAMIVRDMVNAFTGLIGAGGMDEGQPPEGQTLEEIVNATIQALYPGRKQYREVPSAEETVPA